MKFNSHEKRKQHPLAGMIPDYIWNSYFPDNSIDDDLLNLMSMSEKELCEAPMKMEVDIYKKNTIFLAICSYKDLSKNALMIIIKKVGIDCENAFFVAAACGRMEILQHLEDAFPNKLQTMIKDRNYLAFREAAAAGLVNVLEYLAEKAPDLLQDMIKADGFLGPYSGAFSSAARNGHIKVLEYLETKVQSPATLQDMIKANDYGVFGWAARYGHVEVLEYLEAKIQPKEALQDMIKASDYDAFRWAATYGRINVLEYLETKIQPKEALQDMIKANAYDAFRLAAEHGQIKVLEYLAEKAPGLLQSMIKAKEYNTFSRAATQGHVAVLEYLETKIQPTETLQEMIKAGNYYAFREAAERGQIKILEYLAEKAPDLLQDMIKANDYEAFRYATAYGHLNALEYLAGKAPHLLQDMIKADDYNAFRFAAAYGYMKILEYLEKKAPTMLQDMIKAHDYEAFRYAAENGHTNILNFLMRYNTVRLEAFELIARSSLSDRIWTASSHLALKELLKHPAIFAHTCSHYTDKIKPFITEQIKELRARPLHGNPLHRLHNKQEAECLFYLLHHLIEKVGIAAKDNILFLLSIKELHAILPTTRPPQNTTNLALRAAIIKRRSARAGAAWNEIISTFYAIPEVSAQALLDNDYPEETRGRLNLRAIASNTESSMQALTAEEETQLKQLRDHYQPQIQQLNILHSNLAWKNVLNCFENYYNENKATFTNTQGEVITLPLEWDDFQNLTLSLEDNKLAREAYYKNKAHTAYRFFLRPNPWLASNASYVEVLAHGRAADYEHLKNIITVITLAAFDEDKPPLESSGFDLKGRISTFIGSIAHIARAHNWDKTREVVTRRLGLGPTNTLEDSRLGLGPTNSLVIKECYDDLEGDKPSCLPGMKKRLVQSLIAHPLFISTDVIAEEAVRSELNNVIRCTLEQLPYTAQDSLYKYLSGLASGLPTSSPLELTFDENSHCALVAKILQKYHWINKDNLINEIEKKLQNLGLVNLETRALNKNLFLSGDFFLYTKQQIERIAKMPLIIVTEEEDIPLQLSVLESVKHLIAYYCTQTPEVADALAVFSNASNEQELKDAWEQWTPDSIRTHHLANDLQTLYPALFIAKSTTVQMTYDDLPDLYQKLTQEEEAQNQQSSRYRLFELPPALSPFETRAEHAPQGERL